MKKQTTATAVKHEVEQRLLTREQTADFLQVPISLLESFATRRVGPRFIKVGRLVRYRMQDLEQWLEANTVETGAELI